MNSAKVLSSDLTKHHQVTRLEAQPMYLPPEYNLEIKVIETEVGKANGLLFLLRLIQ